MSWNISLTDIDPLDLGPAGIEESATRAYADFKAGYSDGNAVFSAMDEQFGAALESLRPLLGVVGEGRVNVALSGHANPGHKPRQGWGNDMVHVTVTSAAVA